MEKSCFSKSNISCFLKVAGEDSAEYLQSQFSNDLNTLTAGQYAYGFFLSLKGKIRADAFILKLEPDIFFVVSYFCENSAIKAILEANIVADDVEIEEFSTKSLAFLGNESKKIFKGLGFQPPEAGNFFYKEKLILMPGRHSNQENYDLIVSEELFDGLFANVREISKVTDTDEVDQDFLNRERIFSGIPKIPLDLGEDNFPQEGGLEGVGLSFDKGCYLGQEIVNRINAIGKVTRNLYILEAENYKNLILPLELFLDGKKIGELKSWASANNGSGVGLALIKNKIVSNSERKLEIVEAGLTLSVKQKITS